MSRKNNGRSNNRKNSNNSNNQGGMSNNRRKKVQRSMNYDVLSSYNYSIIDIEGANSVQNAFFDHLDSDNVDVLVGAPGTGKTFLALRKALEILGDSKIPITKISIFRSSATSEDVGFLPGTIEEKATPYESGVKNIINTLLNNGSAYDDLVKKEIISFQLPTHERSNTHENQVILIDEAQNLSEETLDTLYTRGGINSHLIISGDYMQTDQKKGSGKQNFLTFLDIISRISDMHNFYVFEPEHIMRHKRVKRYVEEKYGDKYREVYDKFKKIQMQEKVKSDYQDDDDEYDNIIPILP